MEELISDVQPAQSPGAKAKRPRAWLAGLLALAMPGLGHLYLGRLVSALVIWLGAVVLSNLLWAQAVYSRWGWVPITLTAGVVACYYLGQIVCAVVMSRRTETRRIAVPWYVFVVLIGLWAWGYKYVTPVFGRYDTFKTTTSSMETTLMMGDRFTVELSAAEVHRADVIVYLFPFDNETRYVKRCVGLPGDTIELFDKTVYVNGQEEQAPSTVCHIDSTIAPRGEGGMNSRDNFGPYVVAEGSYFVLGDNRDNSSDSRFYGSIPKEYILGKVMSIYWSDDLSRVGKGVE